jgi:hypothetical protein
MSSEIPIDSNFKSLSCQLGGLTLNGNVANGTAASYTVLTINDPAVIQSTTKTIVPDKFLKVVLGKDTYYLPLYQ